MYPLHLHKGIAQARDYIKREMEQAGLEVREDAVGTVIGRLEGTNPELPIIMTGSHFDTVKQAVVMTARPAWLRHWK